MISKFREILLTQYIGSMLVALLVLQAAIEVITRAANTGFWYFDHRHGQSVFGGGSNESFPWHHFVFSLVTGALYLLTAYGLARWLYPKADAYSTTDSSAQEMES